MRRAQGGKIGYQDIIANAKAGHTLQLWIETNGYAFARNIKAKFRVIRKFGNDLKIQSLEINGNGSQLPKVENGAA